MFRKGDKPSATKTYTRKTKYISEFVGNFFVSWEAKFVSTTTFSRLGKFMEKYLLKHFPLFYLFLFSVFYDNLKEREHVYERMVNLKTLSRRSFYFKCSLRVNVVNKPTLSTSQ